MKIRIVLSLVLALLVAVLAVGCSAPQQNAVTTTPNSTQSGAAAADPTATPPQNTASSNEPFAPAVNTTDPTAAPQNTPAAGSTGNITHVTTDELSNLLDAAAEANDDQKVAAYDAACANILEHAYQLPLVYQQTTITTNAALKGVEANPMGVYMLRDFYFE